MTMNEDRNKEVKPNQEVLKEVLKDDVSPSMTSQGSMAADGRVTEGTGFSFFFT